MYDVSAIQDAFVGLVGWRKDKDPSSSVNPMGDMLQSSSGLYFNQAHPLITIKNIAAVLDVFANYTYADWLVGTTYDKGDIRKVSGNYFVSLVDSNLGNLTSNTDYWRQTNPFNEVLREKSLACLIEVIADVLNKKIKRGTAANLLRDGQVLNIAGYQWQAITELSDYAGWRIVPNPGNRGGIIITIDRIAIHQSASATTTVKLYKNGVEVQTTSITGTGTSAPIWKQVNWDLEKGNQYYLAYSTSGKTPVNDLVNYDRTGWYNNYFPSCLPYAEVSGFTMDDITGDATDIRTNANNYGLNVSFSAKCDYTDFLIDHKELFAQSWMKKAGMFWLKEMIANQEARNNKLESNMNDAQIMLDIHGSGVMSSEQRNEVSLRVKGLRQEYDEAVNSIMFDDRSLSKECLPCIFNAPYISAT